MKAILELKDNGAKRQRGYHGKPKRGRGTLKQPVFGVFALPAEQASLLKPCTLSALPKDIAQYNYRHLIAED